MRNGKEVWCKIIESITAPLGFFVLALLIVESFLATVLIGGNLSKEDQMTCVWLGVSLFILVTIAVFILVWFKPENLTFDKQSHLIKQGKAAYGTDLTPVVNRDKLLPTKTDKDVNGAQ